MGKMGWGEMGIGWAPGQSSPRVETGSSFVIDPNFHLLAVLVWPLRVVIIWAVVCYPGERRIFSHFPGNPRSTSKPWVGYGAGVSAVYSSPGFGLTLCHIQTLIYGLGKRKHRVGGTKGYTLGIHQLTATLQL